MEPVRSLLLSEPIVLVHGLRGYKRSRDHQSVLRYFRGVDQFLAVHGNHIGVAPLSATAGISQRARELRRYLNAEFPNRRVHLIAHSLGGLDARFMISCLGMEKRVGSLTTVGTPHLGTSFADWALRLSAPFMRPILKWLGCPYQAFYDLTRERCARFNERVIDSPDVRYFSIAGNCPGAWLCPEWRIPHAVVSMNEGPNDGVVSLRSASYGETLEVWHCDHMNLINQPNRKAQARGLWTGQAAGYDRLLHRLAGIEQP